MIYFTVKDRELVAKGMKLKGDVLDTVGAHNACVQL